MYIFCWFEALFYTFQIVGSVLSSLFEDALFYFFYLAVAASLRVYALLLAIRAHKWVCLINEDILCIWFPDFVPLLTLNWMLPVLQAGWEKVCHFSMKKVLASFLDSLQPYAGWRSSRDDALQSKKCWHNACVSLINPIVAFGVSSSTSWLYICIFIYLFIYQFPKNDNKHWVGI